MGLNEELIKIVQNSKLTSKAFEIRLQHPIRNIVFPKRHIFPSLQQYISDFFQNGAEPRMLGLAGLRGVGKTTLMWQLAEFAFNHISKNIFHFNVNTLSNLGYSLMDVLEALQVHSIQSRFNEYSEPIIFLFDEVHDDEKWAKSLKIIYDECRTAFVIATGSSALLLNQTADLATRMRIEKIHPFKFSEFVLAKSSLEQKTISIPENLSSHLQQTLFFSEDYYCLKKRFYSNDFQSNISSYIEEVEEKFQKNLVDILTEYVSYHNIPRYSLYQRIGDIHFSILELVKRIIYEDVAKTNSKYTPVQFEKLVYRLAASDEVNLDKLSSVLAIKKEEVEMVLQTLDQAELINVIFANSLSVDAKINKNKKAFFMSPSIRGALLTSIYGENLPEDLKSKKWEDIVMMYLSKVLDKGKISFSAKNTGLNPDFIIDTRDKPIVLEVGSKKTNSKQIKKYSKMIRYGILVNAYSKEVVFDDENETLILPLSWFLML